jgi:hypothetical protein
MSKKASTFIAHSDQPRGSGQNNEPVREAFAAPSQSPRLPAQGRTYRGDVLRGAVAIAAYYPGDPAAHRKIYRWVETGRFPHYREGSTVICSRKSTIDRWIELTEMYGMLGKTWGRDDVLKYFGPGMAGDAADTGLAGCAATQPIHHPKRSAHPNDE